MGAKFINDEDVSSATACMKLCCETNECDVFVFEEKVNISRVIFVDVLCCTPDIGNESYNRREPQYLYIEINVDENFSFYFLFGSRETRLENIQNDTRPTTG